MSERTLQTLLPADDAARAGLDTRPRPEPRSRPGLSLAIILTCQLMLVLDATVMNVALPRIQSNLHFSSSSLAWVLDAYTLTFGGLLLLGGRLGDLYGRRRLFTAGIVLFTLASLAGGLSTTGVELLAARVVQGIGAAAAGPSAIALLNSTFTETKARVRALSLFAGMSSAGFGMGLILGGVLTEAVSWRWVLFINVPFGLVAAVLAPRFLKQPPRHETKLDIGGAVSATAGVGSLVYGLIHAASSGWANTLTVAPLVVGLALIATFIILQSTAAHPLVPLHLFRDRNRAAAYANYLLGPAAGFSSFFFLSQYLQDVLHYSPLRTGLAFLPLSILIFTVSRFIPRMLPRFGPKPITITGTVLLTAGLIGFTRVGEHSSYVGTLLWPMIVMGLGMGLAFSPLVVLIMHSVKPEDSGAAGGTMQTVQQTGVSLGIAVLVTIAGSAARSHPATAIVSSTQAALTASAIIAALTVLVALTFRKITQ